METNTPDDQRQQDEFTGTERERLAREKREIDDLDAVPGPDQDLNETLGNLPEEIQDADRRFDLDPETQQAEASIFKLAALITAIVIAILIVVGLIWLI